VRFQAAEMKLVQTLKDEAIRRAHDGISQRRSSSELSNVRAAFSAVAYDIVLPLER